MFSFINLGVSLLCCSAVFAAHVPHHHHPSNATSSSQDISARGGTRKAGLGWGGGADIKVFGTSKVGWYYTWTPKSWVSPTPKNLEFIPMLWGYKDISTFSKTYNVKNIRSKGVNVVLGFNEPQEPLQANMSPQDAARIWKQYLEPLRPSGVRLGSPATSSNPNGMQWTKDFFTACDGGCTVDFIACHWYDVEAADFITYIKNFHDTFQKPVWVTEYACQNFNGGPQCPPSKIKSFLKTTQAYMESQPWVERYAWYGAMTSTSINKQTILLNSKGKLTALGKQYISA